MITWSMLSYKKEKGRKVMENSQESNIRKKHRRKNDTTSLLERQNLTFRQDNNRVSRKSIGFRKK
jgi:IS1 family transposase